MDDLRRDQQKETREKKQKEQERTVEKSDSFSAAASFALVPSILSAPGSAGAPPWGHWGPKVVDFLSERLSSCLQLPACCLPSAVFCLPPFIAHEPNLLSS